jgi:hypothetical protein
MRREMKAHFKAQAADGETLMLHHMHGFKDTNSPGLHKIVDRRNNKYRALGKGAFQGGLEEKIYVSTDPIATVIPGTSS